MRNVLFTLVAALCVALNVSAQSPTVGLLLKDSLAYSGYNLIAPIYDTNTYLIDNCGYLVHKWIGTDRPGFSVRLLNNGQLLRTTRLDKSAIHGGAGGGVELWNWNGDLAWSHEWADTNVSQHHDAIMLPNGNLLVLLALRIPFEEVLAAGRDSALIRNDMWVDAIAEVKTIGTDSAEVVWFWNSWDHVVQDRSQSKPNFGVVSEHPRRLDVNFYDADQTSLYRDWSHGNSLDYNPELDQILISARSFCEVWIIDHSTTTEEAKGSTGGRFGKGGDLLFRWGNPIAYGRGVDYDQKFFGQHDAHWIQKGLPDEGKIAVFNNGAGRQDDLYSSIDVFDAQPLSDGSYFLPEQAAFGPQDLSWQFRGTPETETYSSIFSGSQILPNGDILVCEGFGGEISQVDRSGNRHWSYVCPISMTGPIVQGTIPRNNSLFRAYRYPESFSGFFGHELVSTTTVLEAGSTPYQCSLDGVTTDVAVERTADVEINVSPNPFSDMININVEAGTANFQLLDVTGVVVRSGLLVQGRNIIEVASLPPGLYVMKAGSNPATKLMKSY